MCRVRASFTPLLTIDLRLEQIRHEGVSADRGLFSHGQPLPLPFVGIKSSQPLGQVPVQPHGSGGITMME